MTASFSLSAEFLSINALFCFSMVTNNIWLCASTYAEAMNHLSF
jgi:hypothetical protein